MDSKEKDKETKILNNTKPKEYNIYCWGFSKYGQTGLDNCQYTDEPNKLFIPLIKEVISISCGEFNSSIIFKDNKTYLYGLNTFGQLGNGSNRYKSKKLSIIPLLSPIKFRQISLGGGHVLGISNEGKLFSWGLNLFGQLGLGHNNNINQPTLIEKISIFDQSLQQEYDSTKYILKDVNLKYDKKILEIKAGPQHSLFLMEDNELYSCGFAKFGALGYYLDNDDPSESNMFIKIDFGNKFELKNDDNNNIGKISKISAGLEQSGFVSDDKFICLFGANKKSNMKGFYKFNIEKILKENSTEKISLDNILIKDFQIGKNFAVVLTNSGVVLTAGDNSLGQLGRINSQDTDNEDNITFNKVDIPEIINNISVGYEFTYAISDKNKIYAWGCNKYGQIPECTKNICDQPLYLKKISYLNPSLISCGGYHVSALCNNNSELNDTVKYFKNIPLNKCFNYDDFRKKEIFYERISETVDNQQQKLDLLDAHEKDYQKKLKEYEKKEKLIKSRESGEANNLLEQEDLENIEIEKVLDEEIQFDELVFPEDALIGSGAFGEVKKAFWRKTLVSVKFLKVEAQKMEKQVKPFIEEYNLLKQLRHPNILLYLGGNITKSPYFLVTEFCENGNLFQFLHGKDAPDLEDIERLNLALEIAKGINYLHSFNPPILHRDLKSLNILLDKNYVAKIADFGWARLRDEHMTKLRGTFQWMAPEVITNEHYTEKADVYSFGIILWEFWSKDPPYKGIKAKEVGIKVKNNKNYRPNIPDEVPQEIVELIKCCWDADPEKRPSFINIINYIEEHLKNL